MKAFISYSHKDAAYLDMLHKHLSILRRDGSLTTWFDREILAGDDIDPTILRELETSDLFLALVSPDFLHSNYCYEIEMTTALQRHSTGSMRVVPIIVEPCDWLSTPLRKIKAVPQDGKSVAEWPNQNNAFLDVVRELRRIISHEKAGDKTSERSPSTPASTPAMASDSIGSQYRLKKDFDQIDHRDFRERAYKEIRDYIESSIDEIDALEGIKARFSDITANSFTCTVINGSRNRGTGHVTVHAGGKMVIMGDIYYSLSENAPENTAHSGFSIKADDYELFLQHQSIMRPNDNERVTPKQAGKIIWDELLRQAGISYA